MMSLPSVFLKRRRLELVFERCHSYWWYHKCTHALDIFSQSEIPAVVRPTQPALTRNLPSFTPGLASVITLFATSQLRMPFLFDHGKSHAKVHAENLIVDFHGID